MKTKLAVLFLLVLLAFLGLGFKIFTISRDEGTAYERQVLSQQAYESTTLPFKRGDILDRNGTILATSEKVYNLIIDSKAVMREEENLNATLSSLKQCFPGINEGEVRSYITGHPTSQYRVFLKQLQYDEIAPFMELQADPELTEKLKGVWFEEEYKRVYPNGSLACDVIGFTGKDNTGAFGLEEYYNSVLNGTNGRSYGFLNEEQNLERTVKPAVDGNSIVTTLDANVQSIAEKYLKEFAEAHKNEVREGLGANNLGCIVMEVNTGNILAMASYPTFDLNDPKDISKYYTQEQIDQMEEDGTFLDTCNSLWRNFCISDTYEPGSTIKPFTVATALDTGSITGNETYVCNGKLTVGDHDISCHNRYGDGPLTVKQAVELSCNVGLMHIAAATGAKKFCNYQHNFNFGIKTNVDLAGEARTDSLLYNESNMRPADLATNSFGQSFNVTMIQMITGFSSLVNGGKYYEPHMVSKVTASDGSVIENKEPRILRQTISRSVSDKIIDFCNGVVIEGTGKTARPAGYAIGGKTGTAETLPRGNHEYVVSFMGYAPAANPEYAIYVVVDRPNISPQDDAKYATRIVRSILTEALPYLGVFMTEELSDKEKEELEALQLSITDMYKQQLAAQNGQPETEQAVDENGNPIEGENPEGTEGGGSGGEKAGQGGQSGGKPDAGKADTGKKDGDKSEEKEFVQIWKTFEKDPATGNYVDPNNGHQIDPDTGADLSGDSLLGSASAAGGGGNTPAQ